MAIDIPGRVSVIGLKGCTFDIALDPDIPDQSLFEGLSAGIYCTVVFEERTISAKVLRAGKEDVGLVFQEELTRPTLNMLLQGSLLKPKYDLSVLRKGRFRGQTFPNVSLPQ